MKQEMKQLTFKEYLSLTEDQIFDLSLHYSKKDQQVASRVADSLFNIYAATETILEQVSLERLFQTEEKNRFVSFCPVGNKGDSSGKVRLTSEFFRNPKTKQIIANQNRTGLYDIIKDLASWELKLKLAGVSERVNLGLMPGWTDSSKTKYLFILDLDNKNSFKGNIQKIIESIGIKTFITSTPSGGAHLYFFSTKEESNSPLCSNADVRARTYCLAPGSQTEKGFYTQDIENPFFQKEIATVPANWREIFETRINEFLKPSTHSAVASNPPSSLPFLSIDVTASNPAESLKKKEGEKVVGSKKKTRSNSYRISKGERSMRLTAIAGGLVHSSSSIEDLFKKLIDIRNSRMKDPKSFLDSEVENIAKWVWKKEHSNPSPPLPLLSIDVTETKRSTEIENQGEQTYTKYEQELINILKTISKTEKFNGQMENIAPVIQKFFEKKFNKEYSSSILTKAVGKILVASGFSKVQRRINGQVTRVWNISEQELKLILSF